MNEIISEKLKKLPGRPGVYIMRDENGAVIYVGKAKTLKNRVRQYFNAPYNHTARVQAMVGRVHDFEYIICDSEMEALVLECNLIKQHRPRYNVLLKDDKQYPYVKLTLNEEFPRIFYVREVKRDGARYFGPYPSGYSVRETLELLKKIFKVAHCKKEFPKDAGKTRPCLYYSLGRCVAPCTGRVKSEDYKKLFDDVARFLEGKGAELENSLRERMTEAAEKQEYELAADLRDKAESVKKLTERQKVLMVNGAEADVFALAAREDLVCVEAFYIRNGKLLGRDVFELSGKDALHEGQIMSDFLAQYYLNSVYIPKTVLISHGIEEKETLCGYLSQKRASKVEVRVPERGVNRRIMDMAKTNAENHIEEMKTEKMKQKIAANALIELAQAAKLEVIPERIEAFDISNTGGRENVASMVVFENARPAKREYRRFKIAGVEGANDVACLREALFRRFTHAERKKDGKFDKLPDLLLVDGGKAQIGAALEALRETGTDIPVLGMVKDDRHRTRALTSREGEIGLNPIKSAFRLIAQIQDETHRFAIEYHRKLRAKKSLLSELDEIEGIGPARRKALMAHFMSIDRIKKASAAELAEVKGISASLAEKIYGHFHNP